MLIGCAPASKTAIVAALADAGIPCAHIGKAKAPDFGLHLRAADGGLRDLPRFEVDEIVRLFATD